MVAAGMTAEVLVVVPVLARAQNARPLVESISETANSDWFLFFVCSSGDTEEINAVTDAIGFNGRCGMSILPETPGPGDYARKIQSGYDNYLFLDIPYVLLAADDLRFHPGWDTSALAVFAETGAGVVGTNDLGHPQVKAGTHSTHPFVSRAYIDERGGVVGRPGQVYFDGYSHNYVDVELVQTAQARGAYVHCHESRIEHLHPLWNRSVAKDETYAKGRAGFQADRALFESRKHLWLSEVPA
jgi:hypothetical protein